MTAPRGTRLDLTDADIGDDFAELLASFVRHLRAERKSPHTINSYRNAVKALASFLAERGMPTAAANVSREHVEEYLGWLHEAYAANTVYTRFGGIRAFFAWLRDEGEIARSPLDRIKQPRVPITPPDVLTADEMDRLLKACAGRGFADRRDEALVRLFAETGLRRSEAAAMTTATVDLEHGLAHVVGKGGKPRLAPFGANTTRALDRYLRLRRQHPHAASPAFWLAQRGPLTGAGMAVILGERAAAAGIEGFHLHRLRHSWADRWLSAGGQEGDLMRLAGWKSREMLSRYGASRADQRAIEAARRLGLGEDL